MLGITNGDLEKHLEVSADSIDKQDSDGMTALAWAASRMDIESSKILLRHGASLEPPFGSFPLVDAVSTEKGSMELMKLFLDAGANVHKKDWGGWKPLHWICHRQTETKYVDLMLSAGADIDEESEDGHTPLCLAIERSNLTIERLHRQGIKPTDQERSDIAVVGADVIERGAKLSGIHGLKAIGFAIAYNTHRVLRILMDRHAHHRGTCIWPFMINENPDWRATYGATILHFAAATGDAKTMELLTVAKLGGLDPNARDAHGFTPRDVLQLRRSGADKVDEAFEKLLETVVVGSDESATSPEIAAENTPGGSSGSENDTPGTDSDDDGDGDGVVEEFVDAVESLPEEVEQTTPLKTDIILVETVESPEDLVH